MSPLQMDVTKNDTHTKERPASALTRPSNINKIYGEKLSIYKKNEKSAQNKHFFQRKSIGVMENLFASDLLFKPIDKCNALQLGQNMMSTIEERIGIKAMEKLKEAFIEADTDRNGGLDIFEFKELLITQLHLKRSQINEIENLFHKIDLSSEGTVSWDEFCTYLQNEYSAKEMHSNSIKSMTFNLPAKCVGSPQRDNFLKICGLVDGNFVACGTEGSISFWSPNADLKRSKSLLNVDKIRKSNTKKVTDFLIFSEYNKLMLSTGEREIQFYELSSLETYCQIRGFQSLPLVMDYSVMKNTRLDTCYIIYGDSNGCITILTIQKVGECLRNWKNMKKVNGMASINIENAVNRFGVNMVVWKVHTDWVQSVQYCPEIDRIISCSNSTDNAMVIGTVSNNLNLGITKAYENVIITKDGKPIDKHQERKSLISFKVNPRKRNPSDQIVYKIYKGVKVFDYSKKKNIIATGGMDRIVRIWNPYVQGKPVGIIAGHNAPICFIRIAEEEERIFSFSTDNFLMVWDTQDYTCLLTLRPKTHKIRGDIVSCCYNIQSKSLLVTTDHIHSLTIKQKTVLKDFTNVSHSVALDCCLYSKKFDHVVTASHNSTVRVWSLQYGIIINEFKNAHGNSVISSMCFDSTGLKLVTASHDGTVKVWNYTNGYCLKTIKNDNPCELCDVIYAKLNNNRYIIAVGWDRRINIYLDSEDDNAMDLTIAPLPRWSDDINDGHKEDISSAAYCQPNSLATASYDGVIIIWNMTSGRIFSKLLPKSPSHYNDISLDGDWDIDSMVFFQNGDVNTQSHLISSGPKAHIHFWNIYNGGSLVAKFPISKIKQAMSTKIILNDDETKLYCADTVGYIYCWNISSYKSLINPKNSPPIVCSWRAHTQRITCITLVELKNIILSSSLDKTCRVWTTKGHFIGTFSNKSNWDIYKPATFVHPSIPIEVLCDPLSLPEYKVHELKTVKSAKETTSKNNYKDTQLFVSEQETNIVVDPNIVVIDHLKYIDEIKTCVDAKKTGKRLRHEILKQNQERYINPTIKSEYHTLQIYDLEYVAKKDLNSLFSNKEDL